MGGRLKGRTAVVTGAARGNGKGIARALAAEGASVALWDILDEVEETARGLVADKSAQIMSCRVDIADADRVNEAVEQVLDRFKHIDILVNNAAIAYFTPFLETTNAMRDRLFDVNLKGSWNCARAVVPFLMDQKYGKIINVASVTGVRVSAQGLTAYSLSKGGIAGFTKALALELAGYGINVNAILPGYVDTPMLRGAAKDLGFDEEQFVATIARSVPLKRLCSIEEMGDLAVFLASDESKYITGQEIVIDGGNIIQEEKTAE
jgi:NAD(P)-dependent dehydrogenase (short-subunit alcohol dehydrogenase family)